MSKGSITVEKILQHEIRRSVVLSSDESADLAKAYSEGDTDAGEALVNGNTRFAMQIARALSMRTGVPVGDLFNEACLGILEAAKRYDREKKVKFISYAVHWMRNSMRNGVWCEGTIHVPSGKIKILSKLKNRGTVADAMDADIDLLMASNALNNTNSIDGIPMVGDDDHSLMRILFDQNAENAEAKALSTSARNRLIREMRRKLSATQVNIIMMSYGLTGEIDSPTLRDIADAIGGMSHETVRKERDKALKIIKNDRRMSSMIKECVSMQEMANE